MKEWKCVEVKHHKDVGRTIEEYQREGWIIHTYQVAGMGWTHVHTMPIITCCLRKASA